MDGQYTLFANSKTKEQIAFTLTQESLMRVSTAHYLNNLDSIQLVVKKEGADYAAFYETAIELLPAGSYVLYFNKPLQSSIQGNFVVEIQLAISSTAQVQQDIQKMGLPADCTEKFVPPIVLNPAGAFQFSEDDLQINQLALKNNLILQTRNFTITKPSVFYAKLGYHFLLNDLELSIIGQKLSGQQVQLYGRNTKNQNELNEVLPAGSYSLRITQEVKFDFDGYERFAHCSRFTARILIQDASTEVAHMDCTTLDLVPWNLNDPYGGAASFGGPIGPAGRLHLMGETFMIPLVNGQKDVIRFNLSETSMMSVITVQRYIGDIAYSLTKGSSSDLFVPSLL
jgi:hypothetical protein